MKERPCWRSAQTECSAHRLTRLREASEGEQASEDLTAVQHSRGCPWEDRFLMALSTKWSVYSTRQSSNALGADGLAGCGGRRGAALQPGGGRRA
eukprot:12004731-Alexandrium_andersonii.AAC.1